VQRPRRTAALLLVVLFPGFALARQGSLAVVNLSAPAGHEVALRAAELLRPWTGGRASEPQLAARLAGRPALPPSGEPRDLVVALERVRARSASAEEVTRLGQLLGVDYLLLLQVTPATLSARLYSVGLSRYAPRTYQSADHDLLRLMSYVREQAGGPGSGPSPASARKPSHLRWWIWGAAAVVGGIVLGFALSTRDDSKGELRVQVNR